MAETTTAVSMPKEFSISEIIKVSWDFLKNNWMPLVIFGIVYILAVQVPDYIVMKVFGRESFLGTLLQLVLAVWKIFLALGSTKYLLAMLRGEKVELMDLFKNTDQFVPFLIMYIRYMIVILGGLILLIVPGIYFAFKYAYVLVLVADKKAEGSEAFVMSGKMTEGKKLTMFLYGLVAMVLITIGFIAFVIPGLIAAGVFGIGGLVMYEYLLKHKSKGAVTPEEVKA